MVKQNVTIHFSQDNLNGLSFREPDETLFVYPVDSLATVLVVGEKLVVINHKNKNLGIIGVSNISDTNNWTWALTRGYNAGQALAPLLSESDGRIILYDPMLNKIIKIKPDNTANSDIVDQNEIHINVLTQRILPVDQRYLYLNQYSFDGRESRLVWLNADTGQKEKKHHENHYMNVLNGVVLYNKEKRVAVFGSEYSPELEFYDSSLRLVKKYVFPNQPSTYMELKNDDGPNMFLVQDRHRSFRSASGGENVFAVIYHDEHRQSDEVLIFNWEGVLRDGFCVSMEAKRVSLVEDGGSVCVWGRSGDKDVLQKYRICYEE